MPSDVFYLNIVGAPTDRSFLKNGTPLGPFFRLNDHLHFARFANDGYLDITRIAFPESVGSNRAVVTFNATHLLTDGQFGPYDLTDEFTRRAVYRALFEVAIERGEWD